MTHWFKCGDLYDIQLLNYIIDINYVYSSRYRLSLIEQSLVLFVTAILESIANPGQSIYVTGFWKTVPNYT